MKKAFVDLASGKIVGAKKGSREWWHEKGHLKYNSSEFGMRNSFREQIFFQVAVYFGILSLIFSPFKFIAIPCIIISIHYFLKEEAWCWDYANKKYKRK